MNNVLSLRPGDRVPDFALPGFDGKLRKFIWSFTGAPVALVAVDDLAIWTRAVRGLSLPAEDRGRARCRCRQSVAAAAAPWAKLGGTPEAPLLLCDAERKFLAALLAQGGMGLGPAGALRMRVIVLDANQRVAATFDSRPCPPPPKRSRARPLGAQRRRARAAAKRRWRRSWCCRASSSPTSAPR